MLKKLIQITIIASAAWAFNAQAAQIFLELDGIDGESEFQDHIDEIDVLSWSWGMSNAGTLHFGPSDPPRTEFQDITIYKFTDLSSPKLIEKIATGQTIQNGKLTVQQAGEPPNLEFIIITMEDILVTSVSIGGSQVEVIETITLNFASYCFKYSSDTDRNGIADETIESCYNIAENTQP